MGERSTIFVTAQRFVIALLGSAERDAAFTPAVVCRSLARTRLSTGQGNEGPAPRSFTEGGTRVVSRRSEAASNLVVPNQPTATMPTAMAKLMYCTTRDLP